MGETLKGRWKEAAVVPNLVWSLSLAVGEAAADEQDLTEAGNTTVHGVHEETESFVLTQGSAVATQGPMSSIQSPFGHARARAHSGRAQMSYYEPES